MSNLPQTVGIVGLGQIGGSIALALRKRAPQLRLLGVELQSSRAAKARSFLDAVSTELDELAGADWIVLATPVRVILRLLPELFDRFPKAAVLDTGSTKQAILTEAKKLGPDFQFVGGHPLAGSEKAGETGWNPDLFEKRPFFLCQAAESQPLQARAGALVEQLGARPVWVDPEEHDRLLAYSSHFAYLLSVLYLLQGKTTDQLHPLFLGSGFAGLARLAGSSAEMALDMVWTNRENVLRELRHFQKFLIQLEEILEGAQVEELNHWLRRAESLWQEVKPRD